MCIRLDVQIYCFFSNLHTFNFFKLDAKEFLQLFLITTILLSFPKGKLRLPLIVVFKKAVWCTEVYGIGHCLNEKLSGNQ